MEIINLYTAHFTAMFKLTHSLILGHSIVNVGFSFMEEDIYFDLIHNKFRLNQLTESTLKEFQTYIGSSII